jgi:hypothetical protein
MSACTHMLGCLYNCCCECRVRREDAYGRVLAGRLNAEERSELLQKLIIRARKHRDHDIPRGTQSLEDI